MTDKLRDTVSLSDEEFSLKTDGYWNGMPTTNFSSVFSEVDILGEVNVAGLFKGSLFHLRQFDNYQLKVWIHLVVFWQFLVFW